MILAFDPGVSTGWATYHGGQYLRGTLGPSLVGIEDHLNRISPDEVGYEDFKHRPSLMKAELYSLQVIGVIELWCGKNEITPFKYLPATAIKFWTNDKLKKLNLYLPGNAHKHEVSATKILLKYLQDSNIEWFDKILNELSPSKGLHSL